MVFGPPKSWRSERSITLDGGTVDSLRRHREAQRLERTLAADAYEDDDLVFANELGQPIAPQRISEQFISYRKAAGVPTGSLHTLRHTATTLALSAGVPLHVVAARMGDDPRTMLSTYAHLLPQSDAIAAEAVASVLAPSSH
jgi:integrase